ncbi:uncharacterized protein LOC144145876 isoform X3 [Haemaphysalis longicornis]
MRLYTSSIVYPFSLTCRKLLWRYGILRDLQHIGVCGNVLTCLLEATSWRQLSGPSTSPSLGDGHRQQQGPPHGCRLLRCQQCSYKTWNKSHLKRHQCTHTGERPHQCSHCSKAFLQKSDLDIHLRIHTGDRPYQCHLCPMDFAHKASLVRHVLTHTGERPFQCRFCPKAFPRCSQRKRHEQKVHSHQQ